MAGEHGTAPKTVRPGSGPCPVHADGEPLRGEPLRERTDLRDARWIQAMAEEGLEGVGRTAGPSAHAAREPAAQRLEVVGRVGADAQEDGIVRLKV